MKKHRLNRTTIFLSAISAAIILLTHSGCTKDYIPEIVTQKGFAVNLMISSDSEVSTKSDANTEANREERYINSGYVFVFDRTTGKQVSSHELNTAKDGDIAENTNGTAKPTITAPIKVSDGNMVICVLNSLLKGDIKDVTGANIDEKFRLENDGFETPSESGTGGLPMCGNMVWGQSTSKKMTIYRAVAKIQVKLPVDGLVEGDDITGNFTITNVTYNIYQQAENGNAMAHFEEGGTPVINSFGITAPAPTFSADEIDKINNPLSIATDNYKGASYIYEHDYTNQPTADAPPRLAILLKHNAKGGVKYYRLELMNQTKAVDAVDAVKHIDVHRNTHYKINITKVNSHGYDTPAEAMANPASNIEYEITDDSGDHTISNGQYAISVGAELYANGTIEREGTEILTIAKDLRFILPSGVEAPSGITNTITCVDATTHVPINAITVTPTKLTATGQNLTLSASPEFNRSNVAFKVAYGNLSYVSDPIDVLSAKVMPPTFPIIGNSNSYMVSILGETIVIPIDRVNEFASNTIGASTDWYAEVIWADFNPVSNGTALVVIAQDGSSYVKHGRGKTGGIQVTIPTLGRGGNVIIGIKKKGATANDGYLWSWHLWITDYAPQPVTSGWGVNKAYPVTGGQVHSYSGAIWNGDYNGKVIMDRALGATISNFDQTPPTETEDPGELWGMYYQWGRKDPFPRATTGANSTATIPTYGKITGGWPNSSTIKTVAGSVKYPYKFIPYSGDWQSPQNHNSWGNGGPKSIYDPCPEGWKVPKNGTWLNFSNILVFVHHYNGTPDVNGYYQSSHGRLYKGTEKGKDVAAWYPSSGHRIDGSGALVAVGTWGHSWSSSASGGVYGGFLDFNTGNIDPANMSPRAYGRPVRCLQE